VGSLPPEDGYYKMKEGGWSWKKSVLGFELVEERLKVSISGYKMVKCL
jgi:hypothetical protein